MYRRMLRDRCPLCPYSVTLVYCDQMVVWTKMPLGMEVGLGLDDIALDGDPAPPRKGAQQPPLFGPYLLRPNGWMDHKHTTWYGGRPRPRRHCVRWKPSFTTPRKEVQTKEAAPPTHFRPTDLVRSPISTTAEPSQQLLSSC